MTLTRATRFFALCAASLLLFALKVFGESAYQNPDSHRPLWGNIDKGQEPTLVVPESIENALRLSPKEKEQLRFMERVDELIRKLNLHLDNAGYSSKMAKNQEFRLFQSKRPGRGAIVFNPNFWFAPPYHYHNDDQLVKYALLRAEAVHFFRSHFDADQSQWVFNEEEKGWQEPIKMLKETLRQAESTPDQTALGERDIEFRKTIDPALRPGKVFEVLVRRAFWAIEERAADEWVRNRIHESWEYVASPVQKRIDARERMLAADFGRTRAAMTQVERRQFAEMVQNPVRYGVHVPRMVDPSETPVASSKTQ